MEIYQAFYTHIGGRTQNEDTVYSRVLNSQTAFAIIADGLGGQGGGSAASQIAVKNLAACEGCQGLPSPDQIMAWMHSANQEIRANRVNDSQMKSTAVFLSIFGNQAIWAHIGDSRLYHFVNGRLQDVTLDHSVGQIQGASQGLSRDQIALSPQRNFIVRALGDDALNPEIHPPVQLTPGRHAFLLCTDGLWQYLREDEIWLDLLKSPNPDAWITYLRCRAEGRKDESSDNNSAIALWADV